MMRVFLLSLLLVATALPRMAMAADVPKQVRACADTNDFPPYTYRSRKEAKDVMGYNADYLRQLLAPQGRTLSITQLPWKRCLADTMAGLYDVVLDAAGTPERQRQFHLARSHYAVTPIILFDRRRPPPPVANPNELTQLTRCEVLGWDYSGAGVTAASVPVSAPTTAASALNMLRAGRCQVMLYDLELLHGLQLVGDDALAEGLDYRPVSWVPTYRMHVGVSRKVPYAWDLLRMLDRGVERMEQEGAGARILARHIPH
ncbi:transporter substrate-binding domain-containing protein [Duganella sp. FT92W]|uniref:Transporter substrate-binding domain-containing protein n=1 Tax=Pseudoduganella rivuli TaxID=2666085 RepID=A0A7X2IJS7_9BURK|nr:ABC transporter substrate-binding protein [Pseudoduganella rivuli]MRV71307.1 transporter substrate-binding domain-containing protein [Pseudoduganella rivuli]